jgi:hypothetical protein
MRPTQYVAVLQFPYRNRFLHVLRLPQLQLAQWHEQLSQALEQIGFETEPDPPQSV